MKKSKLITSIVIIFILLANAVGMYAAIINVDGSSKEKIEINFNEEMLNNEVISTGIYVVSDNILKDDKTTPYDRFANSNVPLTESDIDSFDSEFNSMYDRLTYESNLKYQAKSSTTSRAVSNVNDDLFNLLNDETQKKYQWFIKVDFDNEGNAKFTIPNGSEIEKENLERKYLAAFNSFKENKYEGYFHWDENYPAVKDVNGTSVDETTGIQVKLKNPTNVSIVFALPTKLNKQGDIYYNTNYSIEDPLAKVFPFMMVSIAIIIFITFIFPMKYLKEMTVFKNLAKIKLGILLPLGMASGFVLFASYMVFSNEIMHNNIIEFLKEINWVDMQNIITFIFMISIWMLFLFLIMLLIYIIKLLFEKGFSRFVKENTIIGWLYLNASKLVNKVIDFDLDDPINKSVLKIVALNFIIVTIISCFFVFGFFFTIIYSIILFVLLRNKLNDIKSDYEVLLRATKKISNGEFDVDIQENLGVFNSLRDEFSNIKDGFEKAVNEEVKSQRMKTELISNVSHDLKTPLTSIITYVDLLKNDDLSEQQRKEYIATIDRNSLRLKNLIDDLFEVSKVNSGNVKLNLMDVDIVSLIKQAYFENSDKLQVKNLDFKMNFSDDKIVYNLDSSKTYRIFENLLVNISKYALENTRVYIDVQNYDDKVVTTFKNISANEINIDDSELTERFVQGDPSRNTGGSGLGLAIAKSFTELQGGEFRIEVDGDLFKAIAIFKK